MRKLIILAALASFLGAGLVAHAQLPTEKVSPRDSGIALYNQKHFPEAIAALQQAVKGDEKDVIAWYYLGLAFESLGQNENALSSFEHAAKIHPEDYFADAKPEDRGKYDDRLVEIRPILISAANSAVHYQNLNQSLSGKQKQEWADRLADLYEYATLVTAKEATRPAKIIELPKPAIREKKVLFNVRGDISILVILRPDGVVKGVATYGYVPHDLQDSMYRIASGIKFEPASLDGKPVAQLSLISIKRS